MNEEEAIAIASEALSASKQRRYTLIGASLVEDLPNERANGAGCWIVRYIKPAKAGVVIDDGDQMVAFRIDPEARKAKRLSNL